MVAGGACEGVQIREAVLEGEKMQGSADKRPFKLLLKMGSGNGSDRDVQNRRDLDGGPNGKAGLINPRF